MVCAALIKHSMHKQASCPRNGCYSRVRFTGMFGSTNEAAVPITIQLFSMHASRSLSLLCAVLKTFMLVKAMHEAFEPEMLLTPPSSQLNKLV